MPGNAIIDDPIDDMLVAEILSFDFRPGRRIKGDRAHQRPVLRFGFNRPGHIV